MGNDDEMEIDLVQLLLLCIRKWKTIIVVALIFACLLGGFKGLRGIMSNKDGAAVEQEVETDTKVDNYEVLKGLYEARIDDYKNQIEKNDEYESESVLINLNPNSYYSAFITYYVNTDYKIMPDKTYQDTDHTADVINAYSYFLHSDSCISDVKSKTKDSLDIKYLEELINVKSDGNIINIEVVADTEDRATKIADALIDEMASYKAEVDSKVFPHTIDMLQYSKAVETSRSEDTVNSTPNSANSSSYVVDRQKVYTNRKADIDNNISSLYSKLNGLSEPSDDTGVTASLRSVAKSCIKYGVLGAVLGAFVAMGCIVLKAIFESKIVNASEISYNYGLLVLGDYKSKDGSGKLADLLHKMSYGDASISKDDFMSILAANIKTYVRSSKDANITDISLVGAIASDTLRDMADAVNNINGDKLVSAVGNVFTDSRAISAISDKKHVIVAVDRNTSNNSLKEMLNKFNTLNKTVVGAVLFD